MGSKLEIRNTGISVMDVLELISRGFAYERILFTFKGLTYEDIFHAAKMAREIVEVYSVFRFSSVEKTSQQYPNLEKIRQQYPRAYEKWVDEEDDYLRCKHSEGFSTEELAEILHRKLGAIHSRLRRFGLDVND